MKRNNSMNPPQTEEKIAKNIPSQEQEKETTVTSRSAPKEETTVTPEKPLTLEERLAKLEELFRDREDKSHSAQVYEESRKARQEADRQARLLSLMEKLRIQTEEAKHLYPNLDLAKEAKDPRFTDLLKCGLDVRSAFEVVHKDEIISASMEYAAREVERMLTNKVLAEGTRPVENGGFHGPALSKTDPKTMTRQERKDIVRRVFAGEKIVF